MLFCCFSCSAFCKREASRLMALARFLCWERSRSEEHTSELQSRPHLVCRLLLEKKNRVRTRQIVGKVGEQPRRGSIELRIKKAHVQRFARQHRRLRRRIHTEQQNLSTIAGHDPYQVVEGRG